MANYTYEDSVHWMRAQPEYSELVEFCYLDKDNIAAAKRFRISEEFSEVIRLLKLEKSSAELKILDLGCGNGIASYAFASLGHDVVAMDPDISDDVGLIAAKKLCDHIVSGSIETIRATAESLPFSDNTFDVLYERQALHHFSDLVKGLTECARVLKPGGLFLATREHIVNDEQQLEQFLAEHILHQKHGGENAYPLENYIHSLKQAGLTVIQKLGPIDSVINHFPTSNADVSKAMSHWLTSKLGNTFGGSIAKISFSEKAYRRVRSMRDQSPGRLYSFLCTK